MFCIPLFFLFSPRANAQANIIVSSPLTITAHTASPGDQVTGTVTYKNTGNAGVKVIGIGVAATKAGGGDGSFGYNWTPFTFAPGQSVQVQYSRTFTNADPAGTWKVFPSYETSDGVWHPFITQSLDLTVWGQLTWQENFAGTTLNSSVWNPFFTDKNNAGWPWNYQPSVAVESSSMGPGGLTTLYTDLAVYGKNTTQVTSASHPFQAAQVGQYLQINPGTNWNSATYQITAVNGNVATLNGSASTSGSATQGNAMAYVQNALSADYDLPANIHVNNGLELDETVGSNAVGFNWSGAVISSLPDSTFTSNAGMIFADQYIEVCAKMPTLTNGAWPSIWFLAAQGSSGKEIDLIETGYYLKPGVYTSTAGTMSSGIVGVTGPNIIDLGEDLSQAYHTYGMAYKQGQYVNIYFDGTQVQSYTSGIPTGFYFVIINNAFANTQDYYWHAVQTSQTPSKLPMYVKYVKVYNLDNTPPIIESTPLSLSATSVSRNGGKATGTVTIKNVSASAITLGAIDIAARDQAGDDVDFGGVWASTTLAPGQTTTVSATRSFTTADKTGFWTVQLAYQTTDGIWHNIAPIVDLIVTN